MRGLRILLAVLLGLTITLSADAQNIGPGGAGVGTTNSNITQFGGTNVSTGTGTGGAGIPRVTVSSDSFPLYGSAANNPLFVNILNGSGQIITTNPLIVAGNLANNADNVAVVTTGNVGANSYLYGYDNNGTQMQRITVNPNSVSAANITTANAKNSVITSSINMGLIGNNLVAIQATNATGDGEGDAVNALNVSGRNLLYNGSTWDYQRSNLNLGALQTLTTQAAATVNSADQTNFNGKGVAIGVNITAQTGTTTVNVQNKDTASGQYYTVCSTTALASTGFTSLQVYPGITAVANSTCNALLTRTWRTQVVVGVGGGVTATVGASLVN